MKLSLSFFQSNEEFLKEKTLRQLVESVVGEQPLGVGIPDAEKISSQKIYEMQFHSLDHCNLLERDKSEKS